MKFLLLVCWNAESMNGQAEPDPAELPAEEGFPWLDDLQARGGWITGDQLAPPRRGRSVRVRDGKAIVTDGPFAETKEAIGGFDLIECANLEEAVEIAAGHPVAQSGTIEVQTSLGELIVETFNLFRPLRVDRRGVGARPRGQAAVRTPEGERNLTDVPARVAILSTKNEFGIVEYPEDEQVGIWAGETHFVLDRPAD